MSIQFVGKEERKQKDGYNLNIEQSTKDMNMAINVYEYNMKEEGNAYTRLDTHTKELEK